MGGDSRALRAALQVMERASVAALMSVTRAGVGFVLIRLPLGHLCPGK